MVATSATATEVFDRPLYLAAEAEKLKEERQQLVLMDSTRPNPTFLTTQTSPTYTGVAPYSSKKELASPQEHSNAGLIAGIFFDFSESVSIAGR